MARSVRIPINTSHARPEKPEEPTSGDKAPVVDAVPPVTEHEAVTRSAGVEQQRERVEREVRSGGAEEVREWRDRALRLQAEMENFRKRQRRLAEDRVLEERERILRELLAVVDDLERALEADQSDAESLRQGVALTRQSLLRLLKQEGVERIPAKGEVFDPRWHEAVGAVPHRNVRAEPDTIVQTVREGYRLGDRPLRPSRVIIAS
jgi:molecular chaperone GrpE